MVETLNEQYKKMQRMIPKYTQLSERLFMLIDYTTGKVVEAGIENLAQAKYRARVYSAVEGPLGRVENRKILIVKTIGWVR